MIYPTHVLRALCPDLWLARAAERARDRRASPLYMYSMNLARLAHGRHACGDVVTRTPSDTFFPGIYLTQCSLYIESLSVVCACDMHSRPARGHLSTQVSSIALVYEDNKSSSETAWPAVPPERRSGQISISAPCNHCPCMTGLSRLCYW